MMAPTSALERVVEEGIQPQLEVLVPMANELLGHPTDSRLALRCAASVLGQCLFDYVVRPMGVRSQLESLSAGNLEELSDHALDLH